MRNARAGRRATSAAAACALAACSSARPEFAPPRPHLPLTVSSIVAEGSATPPRVASATTIRGDVRFLGGRDGALDLGPLVVYLIPRRVLADDDAVPSRPVVATSRTERFDPGVVAIASGQQLVLANEGPLAHGLFTAELGATRMRLPPGTRTAPFDLPARGPVRFYCALHAEEVFVVFAGPGRHVTVVDDGESYEFDAVAPGRYTLAIWSRFVEGAVRDVYSSGFFNAFEPVWIDPALVGRTLTVEDRP
ncbi:MAG: hypothetical protein R3195_11530 [Gemmatimonadota bacterium]|nr:hypothetical protein [Gemmatimonadota bacterium]